MAAPGVLSRFIREPGPDRVVMDVPQESEQVGVTVAQNRFIPALEEMADGPVGLVEVHRVALIDPLQNLRKRRFAGLDQKMDVVAHEHVSIQSVMIAVLVDGEELNEFLIVSGVFEDLLSLVSARDDVIERPLKLYSRLSRHGSTISEGIHNVKIAIFKSDPNKPKHFRSRNALIFKKHLQEAASFVIAFLQGIVIDVHHFFIKLI